jgi:hypothetical protein
MSWLNRLLEGSRSNQTDVMFPVDVDLGCSMRVHVYFHEIDTRDGKVTCWSYVTDGLMSKGQKELVFTLQCEPNEAANSFPRDPLDVLASINELAEQGRLVDVGGVTQFAGRKLFDRHLAYIDSETFQGVPIPLNGLAAILVTDDELQAVREFGILRAMSRLGFASRYYPCPPWSARSRAGISFVQTRQETILSRVRRGRARGVRIVSADKITELRIDPCALPRLRESLSDLTSGDPFALLTDIDRSATGCLVWQPGQSRPEAITPPNSDGSRLCGCFAMLVPQQAENEVRLFEDGIALMLTNEAWAHVQHALTEHVVPISLPCRDSGEIFIEQIAA